MDINISFFFKNYEHLYILEEYKENIIINKEWFIIKMSVYELESFVENIMQTIEKDKIEVLMSLKKHEHINTWSLDLMSVNIENKIFIIHKFTNYDDLGVEKIDFDFANKKFRRKAKLNQILNPDLNLNSELLWKNSWYVLYKDK